MLPDWKKEIEGSLSKIRSHIVETPTFETSSFGQKVDLKLPKLKKVTPPKKVELPKLKKVN